MIGFMVLTFAAADCFSVYGNYTALRAMLPQPVIQAFCQRRRIQPFKHPPKGIAVWNPLRQFQKLLQPRLPRFSEILQIQTSFPLQIRLHSPMIIMSSSLWRILPLLVRRGFSTSWSFSAILLSSYRSIISLFKCCCPGLPLRAA